MTRPHPDAAAVAPRDGRPLFVLSDVHLGAVPAGTERALRAFLAHVGARRALADHPEVDVAVAGHSHLPALVEVDAGRFYVNAGDWISHMSYATVAPERAAPPVLCRWATK